MTGINAFMNPKLTLEYNPDAYFPTKRFILKFGINHVGYGSTPEEALADCERKFNFHRK